MADVQKELDGLKAGEDWKGKYEQVKKEFDTFKADAANKETMAKKKDAYRALLKEAGVSEKRIDAVLKVTDLNGIELDDAGKVKDAKTRTESIKTEWADFIQTERTDGANTPNPPTGQGSGSAGLSRAQQLAQAFQERRYGKAPDNNTK